MHLRISERLLSHLLYDRTLGLPSPGGGDPSQPGTSGLTEPHHSSDSSSWQDQDQEPDSWGSEGDMTTPGREPGCRVEWEMGLGRQKCMARKHQKCQWLRGTCTKSKTDFGFKTSGMQLGKGCGARGDSCRDTKDLGGMGSREVLGTLVGQLRDLTQVLVPAALVLAGESSSQSVHRRGNCG